MLQTAIEQRQWKSVLSRMQHSPHEISTYVYRIDTSTPTPHYNFRVLPLHSAVMRNPPTLVVSALISAYPEAVSLKCDGNLPLHFALKHGASLDVIQTLVLAYTKAVEISDDDGKTCLEIFDSNKGKWNKDAEKESILNVLNGSVILDDEASEENPVKNTPTKKSAAESHDMKTTINDEGWKKAGLTIVVIGASGDLAKKKTYPSLLHLFDDSLLPDNTIIWGYARSNMSHDDLRSKLRPYLEKTSCSQNVISDFLSRCFYKSGQSYGDIAAFTDLNQQIASNEKKHSNKLEHNRLFYFAIPPNVFEETGVAIKQTCMAEKGWTRVVLEKPFGRDLQSCEDMLATLSKHFSEEQLFRIDHYLGKEMVQNLLVLRFGNLMFERLWDRNSIQCVILTFKEPFGTEGRGGYFGRFLYFICRHGP
jgi:hypothetical protein